MISRGETIHEFPYEARAMRPWYGDIKKKLDPPVEDSVLGNVT